MCEQVIVNVYVGVHVCMSEKEKGEKVCLCSTQLGRGVCLYVKICGVAGGMCALCNVWGFQCHGVSILERVYVCSSSQTLKCKQQQDSKQHDCQQRTIV